MAVFLGWRYVLCAVGKAVAEDQGELTEERAW